MNNSIIIKAAVIQSIMYHNGYKTNGPANKWLNARIEILKHLRLNLMTPKMA